MKQFTNALSNEVWLYRGRIVKKYSADEFKKNFGNQELQALKNQKINAKFNKEKNELYVQYFDAEKFDDSSMTKNDIINVAHSLKELHNRKNDGLKLSPFKKVYNDFLLKEEYGLSVLPVTKAELEFANKSFDILESGKQVLLHNDVVQGNLLKMNGRIQLIDFEYSGLGNKIFDVASFVTERELSSKQYDIFVGEFKDIDLKELRIVSCFLQLFWARWALYKYKLLNKDIYKEIADWKIKEYKKIK